MKRFVLFILICGYCFASNYYVSNQGSDENPGTINSPFKTIQKAADVVVGGDIINILEGSYHEEVTLNNTSGSQGGPIIFQPFSNDRVVLDGTRPITTVWSNHQGNIWKTELDFDIWPYIKVKLCFPYISLMVTPNSCYWSSSIKNNSVITERLKNNWSTL